MEENNWTFPGSRWWKFDFHCHTPKSSDYGSGADQATLLARTEREWIQDYIDAGIHCVAVTDHNCGDWIDPLKAELEKMREEGLEGADEFFIFPGVELTINGAHFLAIFDPSKTTRTISDLLALGRCTQTGTNASDYCSETVVNICKEVINMGGLFIPAHVDLTSTGLFKPQANHSTLDPILKIEGIVAMEVCDPTFTLPTCYSSAKLSWTGILGSDSHHPTAPHTLSATTQPRYPGSHYTWVKMSKPSINGLRLALIDGKGVSIRRSDDNSPFDPFEVAEDLVESIDISNARYMGRGTDSLENVSFSPWLNALIGGRGSGKSTILQLLRLAMRRDDELRSLPQDSMPRIEFERFIKVAHGRNDDGALTSDTKLDITYRHDGARYKLSWPDVEDGVVVREWDTDAGDWKDSASQEIRERFPIRIFSQGQIAALANEKSGALLRLVDESINYVDWKENWDEKERLYFGLCSKTRELELKLQSKGRLVGQLEDIKRKLARFEAAEHAKVLKAYQSRRRQYQEQQRHHQEATVFAERMVELAEEIKIPDVQGDLFDASKKTDSEALAVIAKLRKAIEDAAAQVRKTGEDLVAVTRDVETEVASSEWKTAIDNAKSDYDKLVSDLREQGVQDISEYGALTQTRQRLEREIKEFDAVTEALRSTKESSQVAYDDLKALRQELSVMRHDFLTNALANNSYVRIELMRYGRDPYAARDSLRAILGIGDEPNKFETDIFYRDETGQSEDQGLIAELYNSVPDTNSAQELESRLDGIRSGLVKLTLDEDYDKIGGHLRNRIRKTSEQRPEFSDRIQTWFPEDTLQISYSPNGDGTNFKSITQGSAGQRAAAILAFLLAHGNEPIVVDQPEDDLDNHLIYRLVVQQMRANKQRRQIIAVTHNPNIVVNGDAEMVHALDFRSGQCRAVEKGSLQDAPIRGEICRVMEGGAEAFEERYRRIGKATSLTI
jgi:energy-coupling factor transporter ATP-binding protein EcfA2